MNDDSSSAILVLLILLALEIIITLIYAALTNVNRLQMREQSDAGDGRARRILELTDGKHRLRITHRLTRVWIRFGIATVLVANLLLPLLTVTESTNSVVGLLLIVLVAAVTLILGEIVPEGIGSAYAEAFALWGVYPMQLLVRLLTPMVSLLLLVSRGIARIFGSSDLINRVTEEEIMTVVRAGHSGGAIEEEEKEMIYSVLQLDETTAREIMSPRMDIISLDVESPLLDAVKEFIESGFSRIPLYEENIDNIVGLLYAKDVLNGYYEGNLEELSIHDLIRPAHFVPETKRADNLLKELREGEVHMAIVVDEYGGTSGLVTIENLLEEIVGDIRDEYDINEEAEYVHNEEGDYYLIDASMDLDDLNELLNTTIDTNDADTLGGYIFLTLGRVPKEKETIETEQLSMHVLSIDGRRIRKVRVTRKEILPTEDQEDTIASPSSEPQEVADNPS